MSGNSDTDNPFLALAERQIPAPVKRREMRVRVVQSDDDAPMKPTAQEQAQIDKSIQMRLWRAWRREQLEAAKDGAFGEDIRGLQYLLKKLTIDDGDTLIDTVRRSRLPHADVNTRWVALHLISDALERLRIQNGLPPFDDSLPGEEPTVFEIVRANLRVP